MTNRTKNSIYSIILIAVFAAVWFYRNSKEPETVKRADISISGEAQGSTYNITYDDEQMRDFTHAVDSILAKFDLSLSTYRDDSEITTFNKNDTFSFDLPYFYPVLKKSKEVFEASEGAFDPTIYPLIAVWGLGPDKGKFPDSSQVNEVLEYVGFEKIDFDKNRVIKKKKKVSLDFNAIAVGYSIDLLCEFFKSKGIENMMVELGGELRVQGKNDKDELWAIGIDNPKIGEAGEPKRVAIIKLDNEAISTSGNYRHFIVHEGKKYGHSINPKTGYPIQRDIVSATVVAPTCMEADAWSTVFMVTGLEKSKEILKSQNQLKVFFIYEDENGELQQYFSDNISDNIII